MQRCSFFRKREYMGICNKTNKKFHKNQRNKKGSEALKIIELIKEKKKSYKNRDNQILMCVFFYVCPHLLC